MPEEITPALKSVHASVWQSERRYDCVLNRSLRLRFCHHPSAPKGVLPPAPAEDTLRSRLCRASTGGRRPARRRPCPCTPRRGDTMIWVKVTGAPKSTRSDMRTNLEAQWSSSMHSVCSEIRYGRFSTVHGLKRLPDPGVLNSCMHIHFLIIITVYYGLAMYLDVGFETLNLKVAN